MAYKSSRKRNYKSQREKYDKTTRNLRTTIIFILIAAAVWIFKNRYEIWPELNTWLQ
jgi:hypothetical protein